jgi:3-hydroxyacyl-[acyl-carrier-protein] dehydratase
MGLLQGVLHFDAEKNLGIGIHRTSAQDFWVRGHIPGRPLMPGVVMVELAAQLCAFVAAHAIPPAPGQFFGFAGIDSARFRGQVVPGDAVLVAAQITRLRRTMATFLTQEWVRGELVYEGTIIGVMI